MNQKKKKKSQMGVTLMEVMVAMVILAIGLYMTYSTFPLGFSASYRSKNRTIATQLAQQKMEDIINNREPIDCYNHKTNSDCRCFPVDVNYSSYNYDNLTYDCRYFYGGKLENGKVKNSTFCSYHMGTTDDVNWKPFPLPNNMWWYHIDVTPVIDPGEKFRSRGDLMRVTVRIRGPFVKEQGISGWNDLSLSDQRKKAKGYVEVVFSTLQANKFLGAANVTNATIIEDVPNNKIVTSIDVDNIRNFTVFNEDRITDHERFDPPKISLYGHHKYKTIADESDDLYLMMIKQGGNFYNLDNVEIVKKIVVKDTTVPLAERQEIEVQAIMSNKVVCVKANSGVSNPDTTVKIPGKLYLFTRLYEENPENGGYRTSLFRDEIPETKPDDSPSDLLWWRGSKFQSFVNCCFYDSSENKLWDDSDQNYWRDGENSYSISYQIRHSIGPFKPAQTDP